MSYDGLLAIHSWELSAAIAGEPGEKERQNIHEDSTRVFNGKRSTSSFFAAVHASEPPSLDPDPGSAQRISNSGFCSEQHISIPDSHSGTGAGPDKIFVRRSHRRRAKAHIFGPEKVGAYSRIPREILLNNARKRLFSGHRR